MEFILFQHFPDSSPLTGGGDVFFVFYPNSWLALSQVRCKGNLVRHDSTYNKVAITLPSDLNEIICHGWLKLSLLKHICMFKQIHNFSFTNLYFYIILYISRQHISRAVLEAVCFQVKPSSKNRRNLSCSKYSYKYAFTNKDVRTPSFKGPPSHLCNNMFFKYFRLLRYFAPWWPTLGVNPNSFWWMEVSFLTHWFKELILANLTTGLKCSRPLSF